MNLRNGWSNPHGKSLASCLPSISIAHSKAKAPLSFPNCQPAYQSIQQINRPPLPQTLSAIISHRCSGRSKSCGSRAFPWKTKLLVCVGASPLKLSANPPPQTNSLLYHGWRQSRVVLERKLHRQLHLPRIADALPQKTVEVKEAGRG